MHSKKIKINKNSIWDFGNNILYQLCKDNFYHKKDDVIITKVLFIGRIYAAAVERRKSKDLTISDNFYIDKIAPTIRNSKLDSFLKKLKPIKNISEKNILLVLKTHFYLVNVLHKITKLNKRSFSSKYLHFHLPELFFIYDSRSVKAIGKFIRRVPLEYRHILESEKIDKEYGKFYCKCLNIKKEIEVQKKVKLTNRQFDNILMEIANTEAGINNR